MENWRTELDRRNRDRAQPMSRTEYHRWLLAGGEPVPRKTLIDRYRAAKKAGLPEIMVLTPAEKIASGIPKHRAWNETVGLGGSCRPESYDKQRKRQAAHARKDWIRRAWRRTIAPARPLSASQFTPPQAGRRGWLPSLFAHLRGLGK